MIALFFSVVIQQTPHRSGILFPGFITINQHMPLDTHPAGELNQRLKAGLGKFNDFDTFRIKVVPTLAGQFVNDPVSVSPSTSSQQRANNDDARLKRI